MAPVKRNHEFRDPLHGFIELDRQERALVDSVPFQRLRHIHQLAVTSLVYPGASHKRFEHSLGVMHLAKRVFDSLTDPAKIHSEVEGIVPDRGNLGYWRSALSLAALAHDLGHLPFSHAAEKQLLPPGETHENLTLALIEWDELAPVWTAGQKVHLEDVKKLAVGKKKLPKADFTDWEAILSEIIVGDSFGVDRMDYLLRDSYHLGVSYGRFDHAKLIESLRILPRSSEEDGSKEPVLGIEEGGLHSAEALLLARYFMYEQVYFHPVRKIYDIHLIDFMREHYGVNGYRMDIDFHMSQTDNEVNAAIRLASRDPSLPGHTAALALCERGHFRLVYARNPSDAAALAMSIEEERIRPEQKTPLSPAYYLSGALMSVYGADAIKTDLYIQESSPEHFPVLMADGRIEDSATLSALLQSFPLTTVDSIYASPEVADDARAWLRRHRHMVLRGEAA